MSSTPKPGQPEYSNYIISNDESDNGATMIEFYDFKGRNFSGHSIIKFKAFVTDFSDDFSSNWGSKNVYGRMDPVYNYENTTRKITLSFDMPSFDIEEAAWNSTKLSKLVQYTYPVYTATDSNNRRAQGINRHIVHSPIIGVKFANLIKGLVPYQPLPGFLEGVSIKPEMDAGVFESSKFGNNIKSFASDMVTDLSLKKNLATKGLIKQVAINQDVMGGGGETLLFKLYKVNLTFVPIHTQMLGRTTVQSNEGEMFQSFPSGLRLKELVRPPNGGSGASSNVDNPYNQEAFS